MYPVIVLISIPVPLSNHDKALLMGSGEKRGLEITVVKFHEIVTDVVLVAPHQTLCILNSNIKMLVHL